MINRATPKKSGFTLIEIIIVIVIVGVLSTLALPRFFSTIEFARSLEAMNMMAAIKRAASRCSIMGGVGSDYTNCVSWNALAMSSPGLIPGTHFCYGVPVLSVLNVWSITAERNNFNLSTTRTGAPCDPSTGAGTGVGDTITLGVNVITGLVTRVGSGAFSGIR